MRPIDNVADFIMQPLRYNAEEQVRDIIEEISFSSDLLIENISSLI